jgi:hypothetical protein
MLPSPSGPRALLADLRAFSRERSRHQWIAAGLAVTMPLAIIFMFFYDSAHGPRQGPQIIYAESWPANRSDAQIKADQKKDQARRDAAIRERQRAFQRLNKALGRFGV